MNKKAIALFCGSFNPPLFSHFALAEQILNKYNKIEKIIFVPVSHKYNKKGLISDKHRFNMLDLVCKNNPKFEVSNIEFNLDRQPFTIETMQRMQHIYPEYNIMLIIGSDNLKELETWHKVDTLLSQFKIIVLTRSEDNVEEIVKSHKLLSKYSLNILSSNIFYRTNLSSTFIREELKNKNSIRYLLPDEIIDYIRRNNLYV